MPFKIIIVGTGIAGLGAAIAIADKGHQVVILESNPALQATGSILVIQANASRVLSALGVYKPLLDVCSAKPFPTCFRRYQDGDLLVEREPTKEAEEFEFPLWPVHRAEYQRVLWEAAKKRGVTLRLGSLVVDIDEEHPAVIIKGGERIEGDLVIGADGIKSAVRQAIFPDSESCIRDSGVDCTRFNIPEELIRSNPETAMFLAENSLWGGPSSFMASAPLRRGNELIAGFDFINPRDEYSNDGGSRPQNMPHMAKYYESWAPVIQTVLSLATDAHVWRLQETLPDSCVSKSGKVVLIGDAAHAILPFAGQGGGLAIEDAAALAECLDPSVCGSTAAIPASVAAFAVIRTPRNRLVQEKSAVEARNSLLPDGPQQEQRDARLRKFGAAVQQREWDGRHVDEVPKSIRSADWKAWVLGHDAIGFTRRELVRMGLSNENENGVARRVS